MEPLISVIIPVYNVEKHLRKCVESIISQSYKNIEILLIDDGAKDASPAICDEYAQKDSRVKVIHKQNAGVAKARNTGIENAAGDFFCFIDGDDHVHPDYIRCMLDVHTKTGAEISMCSYVYAWSDGRTKQTRNTQYSSEHIFENSGKDALREMLYGRIYAPACYGKLFRKDISVCFPAFSIGEDMLASADYLLQADNVAMVNAPMYYYMQHDESVMHTVNPDKLYDLVITGDEMMKLVTEKCPENIKAAKYYIVEKNMMALMKLHGMANQSDRIKHIEENIKKYRMSVITDPDAEMRTRLACVISFLGVNTLCKIRNKIAR